MNIKFRSRTTIFVHDLCMIPLSWLGAYWLRFNLSHIPDKFWYSAFLFLPYVIAVQVSFFWFFGLHRGVWRFSSMPDLIRITKSILLGILFISLSLFLFNRLDGVPRSVVPLYIFLMILLLCVPRFTYRFWKEKLLYESGGGQRALIVGAGAAGEMLVRDLLSNHHSGYIPIAFVDDAKNKRRREIRGIRVFGSISQIPELIEQLNIEILLIAIPSAKDAEMRRIVEICEACRVSFQTLPSVKELLSNQISQGFLRDVSIGDILGREPVKLDWKGIRKHLHNQVVLVTGGGGSIGSELCKQLAAINPSRLIIFDQSEFNLYTVHSELVKIFPQLTIEAVLGDVADVLTVNNTIKKYAPDVIFHAASYKHVPLLEEQLRVAVHNNVIGTKIIADAAISAGVGRFVLISTDKAVNPTNVMGATKRAAEILCQNLKQKNGTQFITVRFGNVLDSAGSVVPLFREQIKAGGPVTVTHPDIKRFFMTIPEACQLIMQAETVGKGGEVFVLDMGEPIKISYLAEQMIRLSGKLLADIKIEYIGLRAGEKLYEELFHDQEKLIETDYEKLLLAQARSYDKSFWLSQIEALEAACNNNDSANVLRVLKAIVPEYKSGETCKERARGEFSSGKKNPLHVVKQREV